MLQELRIQNLMLVEGAHLSFDQNFIVLSGESGAGKSAIMEGLKLLLGARSDQKMIRHEQEKACIEALFSLSSLPQVHSLLKEAGIDFDPDAGTLLIRREISISGKNRSFMNHQMVQQSFLQRVGKEIAEVIGQHASIQLMDLSYQKQMLDQFAQHQDLVNQVEECWDKMVFTQRKLVNLYQQKELASRDRGVLQAQLEELLEADLKENEEEVLFAEYTSLIQVQEMLTCMNDVDAILNSEQQGVLSLLKRCRQILDKQRSHHKDYLKILEGFNESIGLLSEVSYALNDYQGSQEVNPYRVEEIDERLSLINKLKKKYHLEFEPLRGYLVTIEEKLHSFDHLDEWIESSQKELSLLTDHYDQLAQQLNNQRCLAALSLQVTVSAILTRLNMPNVEFQIDVKEDTRGRDGKNSIEYFFRPNKGERWLQIRQGASGGELSRVLLALKASLAERQPKKLLILDEIDSGIGGETALGVGELLVQLARQHQLICITHLATIASKAQEHFYIEKKEVLERTITCVSKLDPQGRKKEIARMVGGCQFGKSTQALAEEVLVGTQKT